MKVVRNALKVLLWILVVVLAAILALPLWLGPVVTTVSNAVVPDIVKTDFHLGHLSLNPYTARFELGDLQLANPAGYPEKYAATVGDIAFDVKTFSLLTDVIHIEEIKIRDIFVSYVSGGPEKINNFQQIQYNVAGGREAYEATQAKKEAEQAAIPEDVLASQEQVSSTSETSEKKTSRKFIIDRLEISGLMVQFGFVPIRLPGIVLTDIGLKTGGATIEELSQQVWSEILRQAGAVGDQLKALGAFSDGAAKKTQAVLLDKTNRATSLVNSTFGTATGAANGTVNAATGAVNDSVKAVGAGAKKAVESIKGLW